MVAIKKPLDKLLELLENRSRSMDIKNLLDFCKIKVKLCNNCIQYDGIFEYIYECPVCNEYGWELDDDKD